MADAFPRKLEFIKRADALEIELIKLEARCQKV